MKKTKKTTIEERNLFRQRIGKVTPIVHDRVEPVTTRLPPIPKQQHLDDQQVLIDMMSDLFEPEEIQTGEELLFARSGIQPAILRKLRRGQYRLSAELDLHGLIVPTARQVLANFLHDCAYENRRCIRIIHGKGLRSRNTGPVLKSMVNSWLKTRDEVLAFCSALPRHGGTGAVYVLLKRSRPCCCDDKSVLVRSPV